MIFAEEDSERNSELKKNLRMSPLNFDKETLNQLLIDSGWEGLKEKEILFFYN